MHRSFSGCSSRISGQLSIPAMRRLCGCISPLSGKLRRDEEAGFERGDAGNSGNICDPRIIVSGRARIGLHLY